MMKDYIQTHPAVLSVIIMMVIALISASVTIVDRGERYTDRSINTLREEFSENLSRIREDNNNDFERLSSQLDIINGDIKLLLQRH